MQPLVEPVPESRLADVLMGELFPRQEIDDTFVDIVLDDLELGDPSEAESEYAAYEIVRDPFATTEFVRVRDTRYDHIVTVEFPRTFASDVLGDDTAPVPKFSAPYERIEIEHDFFAQGDAPTTAEEQSARFMSYAQALPFPLYSAPFERVELGELPTLAPAPAWPDDSTELVIPRRATSVSVFAIALVLACAIAFAVGLALLVVRSATA